MFKLDLLTLEDNIYQSRNLILCLNPDGVEMSLSNIYQSRNLILCLNRDLQEKIRKLYLPK